MSDVDVEFAPELPIVVPALKFEPLEAFAAVDEPGSEPLVTNRDEVGAVVPVGGLIVVYGDGGSGKTTLLIDQALHFAAGAEWGGVLTPARPLRVAWIENEGPRPMMREKFRRKLASWQGSALAGRMQVLEEPWAQFSFRQDLHRDQLAEALDAMQADLLIVGPLSRIGMEGGGTSDEIREFLEFVHAVQRRCAKPPAVSLVHHENRAGQVSGTWEREPDLLVHVQGQGHGRTRVYWQKVRWCSALHATSTQLVWADGEGFQVEERPEITTDTIADDIRAAVRELPGGSWTKIRGHVTGNASEAAAVRDRLIAAGEIINGATRDGHFNLWAADDPQADPFRPQNGPGTALFPLPEGAPVTEPFPRSRPIGNGERNGTGDPGRVALEAEVVGLS